MTPEARPDEALGEDEEQKQEREMATRRRHALADAFHRAMTDNVPVDQSDRPELWLAMADTALYHLIRNDFDVVPLEQSGERVARALQLLAEYEQLEHLTRTSRGRRVGTITLSRHAEGWLSAYENAGDFTYKEDLLGAIRSLNQGLDPEYKPPREKDVG